MENYPMSAAEISLERVSHFSTDSIMYVLVLKTKAIRLKFEITKQQFYNIRQMGVVSYSNTCDPINGSKMELL